MSSEHKGNKAGSPAFARPRGPRDTLCEKSGTKLVSRPAGRSASPAAELSGGKERLLHELQVHQVELETQNEELRRSEAAVDAARARYFDLYDMAPVGYLTLSAQGRILEVNLAVTKLLGTTASSLVSHFLSRFVFSGDQDIYHAHRRRVLEAGSPQEFELRLQCADGSLRWVKMSTSAAQNDEAAPVCRVVVHDIHDRRRAEDALALVREEKDLCARFTEESPAAILRILANGVLAYANPASFALLSALGGAPGAPAPEALRQPALAALALARRQESEFVCAARAYVIVCAPFPEAGYVNLYGRDVTDERAAEVLARQASARERDALALSAAARAAVDTLNAMGDGVMLLDMAGRVLSINPALEKMVGIARAEAFGQPARGFLSSILPPGDARMADEALAKAMQGQESAALPALALLSRNGRRIPILPALAFVHGQDERPTAIVVTLRDLSGINAVRKSLEESERKYRELVENANSCIMRITPDHTITFFNEYAQAFFGYDASEVIGRNVVDTIVPAVDSAGQDLRAMLRKITADPEGHASNENENRCKDGRRVWLHWANRAVRDERGNVVEILCVGTDITRRREMEAEALRYQQRLQELSERLAVAEEEDRWRLSRYIHDTIIQNLSLSSIRLGSMIKPLSDAELREESDTLRHVRELLCEAMDQCRMVMSDLTPALLYELGLVPALREFAHQVEKKHGARLMVDDDGQEKPMSHPLRGMLFECARELIMNALKHAGPGDIRVAVRRRDGELVMHVADGGKGFDAAAAGTHPDRSGGFGLFSIRERMEGLGGRLEIESAPGRGTTATIAVPLAEGGGPPRQEQA